MNATTTLQLTGLWRNGSIWSILTISSFLLLELSIIKHSISSHKHNNHDFCRSTVGVNTEWAACPILHTAVQSGQMCHLKVSVDDGGLALVQPRNSVTGVTEDLQHLGLGEASLQPLIHQVDHLTPCKTISSYTSAHDWIFTFIL